MDWGTIFSNSLRAGVGVEAATYALAAIGLNIHFGYTGLLNFGQVGFMAVGAYGVGISTTYYGWNPVVGILVGLGAAVVLALILGLPALRLRADYLAITTIAASEIIRNVARSVSLRNWSGGSNGLSDWASRFFAFNPFDERTSYGFGPFRFLGNRLFTILIAWALVALVTLFVWGLIRSPWGRVLKSIREDEDAARALGKNAYWYKLQSLIIGGMIGGVAGMVIAIDQSTVQPDFYLPVVTFFIWTALILGGVGRVWSPIVGSMIFWFLLAFSDNVLREAVASDVVPDSLMSGTQVGVVRFMFVGLGLVLLMIFRPQGIFGNRNEMMLDAN